MDIQAQMQQASELIKQKRYEEAKAILIQIDDPTAKSWLIKIEAILDDPFEAVQIPQTPPQNLFASPNPYMQQQQTPPQNPYVSPNPYMQQQQINPQYPVGYGHPTTRPAIPFGKLILLFWQVDSSLLFTF